MIANDVVETIGELAAEFDQAQVDEILVRLGVAPDELERMILVALWSVDRINRGFDSDPLVADASPHARLAATWLDGFAIGVSVARRDAQRSL